MLFLLSLTPPWSKCWASFGLSEHKYDKVKVEHSGISIKDITPWWQPWPLGDSTITSQLSFSHAGDTGNCRQPDKINEVALLLAGMRLKITVEEKASKSHLQHAKGEQIYKKVLWKEGKHWRSFLKKGNIKKYVESIIRRGKGGLLKRKGLAFGNSMSEGCYKQEFVWTAVKVKHKLTT